MGFAELILAALAAGASSGITEATTSAVGEAYTGLRDRLRTLTGRPTVTELTAADDPRQRLLELLRDAGRARARMGYAGCWRPGRCSTTA
ncbi:hypothetical protein [Actinoplanes derwentensis]|uniref:Uncharacterized protein n=1 Tax=Actinoplanes derwentensis TaxID=113562 RepID=A0A1H1VBL3_9ACTN|nr:hypothetical protein [Actinoplanes derwentensis]GID83766.1 hypothetical protein Ade03nite_26900 [Actinoplanes derwentensis]SDS81619.1 hypothetical protein SAMN04489716_1691 [Actinoplanes derwentensis]